MSKFREIQEEMRKYWKEQLTFECKVDGYPFKVKVKRYQLHTKPLNIRRFASYRLK